MKRYTKPETDFVHNYNVLVSDGVRVLVVTTTLVRSGSECHDHISTTLAENGLGDCRIWMHTYTLCPVVTNKHRFLAPECSLITLNIVFSERVGKNLKQFTTYDNLTTQIVKPNNESRSGQSAHTTHWEWEMFYLDCVC